MSFLYMRAQRNGFTMLPLARHKSYQYALIFGAGFFAYKYGQFTVASVTGDMRLQNTLARKNYLNAFSGNKKPTEEQPQK